MADDFKDDVIEDMPPAGGSADVDMGEDGAGTTAAAQENGNNPELPFAEGGSDEPPAPHVSFAQYLQTAIVTLLVGSGEKATILTAHQGLLVQSPYFAEACAEFAITGSPRQVEFPGEDLDAVGSFLEFLYTGEYFPKKIPGQRVLEKDSSIPEVDMTGDQLLKHARVYTLAEKLGLIQLKDLASSKIHCINSTAKGEIAYARYIYEFTPKEDAVIRAPVANFWATRSHTFRSEAEAEFRALCLEFPEFGYDVLTRVLDEKLKRERNEKMHPSAPGSVRKRARHSGTAA